MRSFEVAKIRWTLEGSNSPMSRIYATCKHLGSKLSYSEIEQLVNSLVEEGVIIKSQAVNNFPSTYRLQTT